MTSTTEHGPECWRQPAHHACAIEEIDRLQRSARRTRDEAELRRRRERVLDDILRTLPRVR
jgi:hypothetical protein